MLKIVHPICCGIDVHKNFAVAFIASTDKKDISTYKSNRFSTFTSGLVKLSEWLLSYSCRDVCRVTLAHPKYLKVIRCKKTDKKDARWFVDLFKHDLVVNSFMPPFAIRQLGDLMCYRAKLTYFA